MYQAPITQGTFNDSTFNQARPKRKLPEDSETLDDNTNVNEEVRRLHGFPVGGFLTGLRFTVSGLRH